MKNFLFETNQLKYKFLVKFKLLTNLKQKFIIRRSKNNSKNALYKFHISVAGIIRIDGCEATMEKKEWGKSE